MGKRQFSRTDFRSRLSDSNEIVSRSACRKFSVVFFCKKSKTNRKGKAPIYARVATNGSNCEIHFNCHTEPEKWNQKAERTNARDALSLKLNEVIQTTRTKIIDIWEQLLKEGIEPDCFTIKERFNDRAPIVGGKPEEASREGDNTLHRPPTVNRTIPSPRTVPPKCTVPTPTKGLKRSR